MALEVIEIKPEERPRFFELAEELGTVFSSQLWCEVFREKLKLCGIFSDTALIGGFVIYETRMKLVKSWITPPFSPHIALFFQPAKSSNVAKILSYNKSIVRAVAEFIRKQKMGFVKIELPPGVNDVQPFIWEGMDVTIKYTYRLDLTLTKDELIQRIDPKERSKVSIGGKHDLLIERNTEPDAVVKILRNTFSKKEISTDIKLAERIVKNLSDSNGCFASVVKKNDKSLGAFVCVCDSHTAYYLLGGFTDEAKSKNIGHLGVWDCIMQAQEKELSVFDFEGSMIPGVEQFFRSFGGEQVVFFEVRGGNKLVRTAYGLLK